MPENYLKSLQKTQPVVDQPVLPENYLKSIEKTNEVGQNNILTQPATIQPIVETVASINEKTTTNNSNTSTTTTNKSELLIKLPKGVDAELTHDKPMTASGNTGVAMKVVK